MAATADTKPAEKDTKKPADKPVEPDADEKGDSRTTLSQQATKPGDSGALGEVRKPTAEVKAPGSEPEKAKAPALDKKTLEKAADELHEALTRTKWLGMRNATDQEKVLRILTPMTEADRRSVEQIYEQKFGDKAKAKQLSAANADTSGIDHSADFKTSSLRSTITQKFGGPENVEQAKALSVLNRVDGKTNDAGALMVAINQTRDDRARGNVAIRAVFETLNKDQIAEMERNFKRDYGKSWSDSLKELGSDLTPQTIKSLEHLKKGVDQRTPEDVKSLTKLAIDTKDTHLLGEALRGDSPAAVQARKEMMQDRTVLKQLMVAFPSDLGSMYGSRGIERLVDTADANMKYSLGRRQSDAMALMDPVARDYLEEGRISLKTITTENTSSWLFENKENIELAARNAAGSERGSFTVGQKLLAENKQPQTPEEREAKDYYNKIHKIFTERGTPREVAIWEDQLKNGRETVLSEIAKTHSDGWAFGAFSGHKPQDMMSKAENLSEKDWKDLRDPEKGKAFRAHIENGLMSFTDKGERDRIMKILDDKAAKETYEESKTVHRDLAATVADNKGSYFLGMGTSYETKNLISNLSSMASTDAARLKADPAYKQQVQEFISKEVGFTEVETLLAQRIVEKASVTGQVPKLDAQDALLKMGAEGAKQQDIIAQAQKALAEDPKLRERLSQPYTKLSDSDKTLRGLITENYLGAYYSNAPYGESFEKTRQNMDRFMKSGELNLQDKLNLGFDKKSVIEAAATAPVGERDAVKNRFTPEEQKIIANIAASGGKTSLADRVAMLDLGIIKSPNELKSELEKLHSDKDGFVSLQRSKDEFTAKYGRNLDDVFLNKVEEKEKDGFKTLLTPTDSDGRQTFYNNVWKELRSESGAAADGTGLTMQKSIDQAASSLEEYQRIYKTLPLDKQKALDEYFNSAWEQHKRSKEKLAEVVITATITAAALAAAPFTAGASVAALAAYASVAAAGGAAFTVGAKRLITGNDYDKDHILRDIVHGAVSGALIFALPPAGRVTSLFNAGSRAVLAETSVATAMAGLVVAERTAVQRTLTQSLMQAGKAFGEKEALEVVKSAAPSLTAEAQQVLAREITAGVTKNYSTVIEKGVVALQAEAREAATTTATRQFGKQILESSLIGAGGNAVATIADAPFNKDGLDLKSLATQTLVGATVGAVLPVAFKGITAGSKYVLNLSKETNALGATEVLVHATPGEPVQIRHSDGSVETITGKSALRDGDQVVSGPTANPAESKVASDAASQSKTPTDSLPSTRDNRTSTSTNDGAPANPAKPAGDSTLPKQEALPGSDKAQALRRNEQGNLVNENGQLVNERGKLVNEKGNLINEQGKTINEKGQLINDEGKLVNERGKLVNERGQTIDTEGRVIDSKGNLIEKEFPDYPTTEFDRVRSQLVDDLHSWKSIEGNNVGEKFDEISSKLGLSAKEKAQILDGLQTVREHGARMQDIDPEQAINWKHTQREFGAAVDFASRNNLSKADTQDLLLSAMFSDGLKTKFNFTTHNVDGAAAFEQFARKHLADLSTERLAGIKQAILEHQVAPPQFMAMIYGGAIAGSIKAEGRAMTEIETKALQSLKDKISNPFALKPDELIDVPGGPQGAKAVKLTGDEQALLQRTGLDHWYVPNEGNAWNKFSRGLIDADGIDNYAGPGGLSKIVGLRGPGKAPMFQDRHVLHGNPENASEISSVDSWKQSQRDFLGDPKTSKKGAASETTKQYVEQQSARVEADIKSAQGRVNEWINSPAGRKELGLPPEGSIEKIPGWTGSKDRPDLIDYSKASQEELDRARKIWDKFGGELGREQRVELRVTPDYKPVMQSSVDAKAADDTAKLWNQAAKNSPDQVTLERAGTGENQWIVKAPDGKTATMQAEITTNADGSQTVKYITDQRANWYQKAYANGAPENQMSREVTYHPDGTVSTKGFDSDFVPERGSILRKDARFGEYWTSPQGKQTWIDGEKRIWNEVTSGIWHSKDGVLAENVEYVKRGLTAAKPLDAPLEWSNVYNGKESKMLAKAGDYKIDEGNGKFYVVDKEVFERTYSRAPGTEDKYVRNPIRAREAELEQTVQTRAGDIKAKPGDYLVTGVDGETYVVEKAKFHDLYERSVAQPSNPSETFKLPSPIGPSIEKADGTIEFKSLTGTVSWDKKTNVVTISDQVTGTSETWSGLGLKYQSLNSELTSETFTAPTTARFYFNNGAEERIDASGLRLVHTPDMDPGVFRAEDGGILIEAPRTEPSPLAKESVAPKLSSDEAGVRQLTDADGLVWKEKDGKWINEHGILSIDENGQKYSLKNGSAVWIDSEGKKWQRGAEDNPGIWHGPNGATYQEGSGKFTKRTKDDAHAPEILASIAPAGVVALAVGKNILNEANSTDKSIAPQEPSPTDKVTVRGDGSWSAKLKDGRVVTPDSPGPWEVHLQDGTTLRRQANTLEKLNADGSGKVTIYDASGKSKEYALQAGGKFINSDGVAIQYHSALETPPSTPKFDFMKNATVKAEVAKDRFEWKDAHGNIMHGEIGDYKVTQPNGAISSARPEIFAKTYSPVDGKPGEFAKTAVTQAQQLKADAAIPTLEGMGTGHKGDWVATGPEGERYIVKSENWNQLYHTVQKPAEASPTFEFQKKASVKAEKSNEPFEWKDWQGNPKTAKPGDWKVTQPDGSISSVEPSIFEKTYSQVEGKPGEYAKTAITKAQQLNEPTVINTKEGLGVGEKNDWIVTGPEGEQYIIQAKKFDELYRSAQKPAEASPMFEFQKKASVKAEKSNEPFDWKDWQGNPKTAKPGDWKVTQPDGSISSVEPSIFEKTYSQVEGKPGEYAKTAITKAQQLNEPTVINTKEGLGIGQKNDWIVTGPEGEQYIIQAKKFDELYRTSQKPASTSESFEFQKKASVKAEKSNEPFDWKDWQGNPKTAKPGDWKVTQPDGSISSVEPSIFEKTYSQVEGKPGEYAKTAITNAQQLNEPTVINTKEGIGVGKRGDWIVTGPEGEQYIIEAKKFQELYRPAPGNTPPPPFRIDIEGQKQDYIKTGIVKAEMINEDGFKWTNHDAAAGHQEQVANKGDFMIYPADGSAPYVADGAFFRKAYHDMPGFPGKYAKTQTANAQILDGPASVNHPSQGITSGGKGDYLVADKDGLQYIVPKTKFESQYAPQKANQKTVEPMNLPRETSPQQDLGAGVFHSTWEHGDIMRDTNANKIFIQNKETGDYRWYQDGKLIEERRSIAAADGTKISTIRYPYQDIESVSRLPSPQEYNQALLKTEYQGETLAKVKDQAMQMPDTLKDKSIDPVARKALQDTVVENRWNDLLRGNDATAKQLEFGPPQQEKKARILMGLTGSGKTSSGMADLKGKGYMVLESDELKPMLPEYKGGIGATALRNESNMLNDKLLDRAVEGGYNFVLPGVGTNAQWMKETIKKLSDAGWSVDLVFVDIPPAESMSRVVSRFQKEGRFVDPGFLVTHGNVPAENYRQVVNDTFTNGTGLTGYRHVWNYGEKPIVLEEGRIERK